MSKLDRLTRLTGAAALLITAAGCQSLDVANPNAPDRQLAFSDPGTVKALAGGAFKTWFNVRQNYDPPLTLSVMADGYTAAWNNFNIRYYTSYVDCGGRCGWSNDPTSSYRFEIENFWYGYYSALSSANDVLTAIRTNGVVITDAATTKMVETVSVLAQGLALAGIALNYDQGYVLDETTDLSTLKIVPRLTIRDGALTKLDAAIALAEANTFDTPPTFTGLNGGPSFSNGQLAKIARTAAAELLAQYPRNGTEWDAVDWSKVAGYASAGVSTGDGVDFGFLTDPQGNFFDGVRSWSNEPGTMRLHTRVSHMISPNQVDPWPSPNGNNPPVLCSANPDPAVCNSDLRVGDGSFSAVDDIIGEGSFQATPNAGTDFAFFRHANQRPARGQYHQSNLAQIRYFVQLDVEVTGAGPSFAFNQAYNDLLWAEALIKGNGDLNLAASLINKTRVGRGGLTPAAGGDGAAVLLDKLRYEDEIEMLGQGSATYYNERKWNNLEVGTPRQMPIPAKELTLLQKELYTFGGVGKPDMAPGVDPAVGRVPNVRDIWADHYKRIMESARRSKHM